MAKRLAKSWMKRLPSSIQIEDLESAAMMGLWDAINRKGGVDYLENLIAVRIRGSIIDELRRQDWLKRRQRTSYLKGKGIRSLTQVGIYDPAAFEDFEINSNLQLYRLEFEPDADDFSEEVRFLFREAVKELPKREQLIIGGILQGDTLKTISKRLKLSEPRICQLKTKILKKLRDSRHLKTLVRDDL